MGLRLHWWATISVARGFGTVSKKGEDSNGWHDDCIKMGWDGPRLSRQQLLDRARAAVNKVGNAFDHVDQLDIQAMPVEEQQYVQLFVNTSADQQDCERMRKMLKDEFAETV